MRCVASHATCRAICRRQFVWSSIRARRGGRDAGNGFRSRAQEMREHASRLRELLLRSVA
jgi:hypothetical protein